jgi:hypothetical protein
MSRSVSARSIDKQGPTTAKVEFVREKTDEKTGLSKLISELKTQIC